MPTPFLSSEEYDERAHQLYDAGEYEQALSVLDEGLALYPNAIELHVGVAYARLAREEFAWAKRAFEHALSLDSDHEDALGGLGETRLRMGNEEDALRLFRRTVDLGFSDDVELMLQIGRALFREGLAEESREYFEFAVRQAPESAEAISLLAYAHHRSGDDEAAISLLRRALRCDPTYAEARVYLGNVLYDGGEAQAALYHLDRTNPEDHWDELGIWRLLDLKRSIHKLDSSDADVARWERRILELNEEVDPIDAMLAEIEQRFAVEDEQLARQQLELFGAMLSELAERGPDERAHRIMLRDGRAVQGTWEEIVRQMKEANASFVGRPVHDFMMSEARRGYTQTGVHIPISDAESFIKGSADAGLLRILR
jgi:tetratricopeptide (TPR) repeat protein